MLTKPTVLFILGYLFLLSIGVYIALNTYQRHGYQVINGQKTLCVAKHIALPGYETYTVLEQWENLSKWVGTKIQGQNDPNPEKTAGLALLKTPICPETEGYHLEEKGAHWFLHKHERLVKYFTMKAYYRISPWKAVPVKVPAN
ncbi:MAG: hypothetical protein PHT40_01255 [Patescibacteria group bacterium]|nr:hypothetical protein [Patescibacteria group bacterium]